jgi:hypothetical protein
MQSRKAGEEQLPASLSLSSFLACNRLVGSRTNRLSGSTIERVEMRTHSQIVIYAVQRGR